MCMRVSWMYEIFLIPTFEIIFEKLFLRFKEYHLQTIFSVRKWYQNVSSKRENYYTVDLSLYLVKHCLVVLI